MLKVYSAPSIEDAIRKQAALLGVPYSHYLAPFLQAIADGRLTMVPHFPAPQPSVQKAA
jgi:hypothetical protein